MSGHCCKQDVCEVCLELKHGWTGEFHFALQEVKLGGKKKLYRYLTQRAVDDSSDSGGEQNARIRVSV